MAKTAKKTESFEKQLSRLEEIVRGLEGGELPLEDSLRVFEEGVKLARGCHERLGEAERRVELLLQDGIGGTRTEPFAEDDILEDEDDLEADLESEDLA
jgi:exodeoxyribonuclease VII small subunit